MTTIFEKLTEYQSANSVPPLTHIQKSILGRNISAYWNSIPGNQKLPTILSAEDTGTFYVKAYPDWFADKITELIEIYYKSIRKRKKTVKRKPVWTHKITSPGK